MFFVGKSLGKLPLSMAILDGCGEIGIGFDLGRQLVAHDRDQVVAGQQVCNVAMGQTLLGEEHQLRAVDLAAGQQMPAAYPLLATILQPDPLLQVIGDYFTFAPSRTDSRHQRAAGWIYAGKQLGACRWLFDAPARSGPDRNGPPPGRFRARHPGRATATADARNRHRTHMGETKPPAAGDGSCSAPSRSWCEIPSPWECRFAQHVVKPLVLAARHGLSHLLQVAPVALEQAMQLEACRAFDRAGSALEASKVRREAGSTKKSPV